METLKILKCVTLAIIVLLSRIKAERSIKCNGRDFECEDSKRFITCVYSRSGQKIYSPNDCSSGTFCNDANPPERPCDPDTLPKTTISTAPTSTADPATVIKEPTTVPYVKPTIPPNAVISNSLIYSKSGSNLQSGLTNLDNRTNAGAVGNQLSAENETIYIDFSVDVSANSTNFDNNSTKITKLISVESPSSIKTSAVVSLNPIKQDSVPFNSHLLSIIRSKELTLPKFVISTSTHTQFQNSDIRTDSVVTVSSGSSNQTSMTVNVDTGIENVSLNGLTVTTNTTISLDPSASATSSTTTLIRDTNGERHVPKIEDQTNLRTSEVVSNASWNRDVGITSQAAEHLSAITAIGKNSSTVDGETILQTVIGENTDEAIRETDEVRAVLSSTSVASFGTTKNSPVPVLELTKDVNSATTEENKKPTSHKDLELQSKIGTEMESSTNLGRLDLINLYKLDADNTVSTEASISHQKDGASEQLLNKLEAHLVADENNTDEAWNPTDLLSTLSSILHEAKVNGVSQSSRIIVKNLTDQEVENTELEKSTASGPIQNKDIHPTIKKSRVDHIDSKMKSHLSEEINQTKKFEVTTNLTGADFAKKSDSSSNTNQKIEAQLNNEGFTGDQPTVDDDFIVEVHREPEISSSTNSADQVDETTQLIDSEDTSLTSIIFSENQNQEVEAMPVGFELTTQSITKNKEIVSIPKISNSNQNGVVLATTQSAIVDSSSGHQYENQVATTDASNLVTMNTDENEEIRGFTQFSVISNSLLLNSTLSLEDNIKIIATTTDHSENVSNSGDKSSKLSLKEVQREVELMADTSPSTLSEHYLSTPIIQNGEHNFVIETTTGRYLGDGQEVSSIGEDIATEINSDQIQQDSSSITSTTSVTQNIEGPTTDLSKNKDNSNFLASTNAQNDQVQTPTSGKNQNGVFEATTELVIENTTESTDENNDQNGKVETTIQSYVIDGAEYVEEAQPKQADHLTIVTSESDQFDISPSAEPKSEKESIPKFPGSVRKHMNAGESISHVEFSPNETIMDSELASSTISTLALKTDAKIEITKKNTATVSTIISPTLTSLVREVRRENFSNFHIPDSTETALVSDAIAEHLPIQDRFHGFELKPDPVHGIVEEKIGTETNSTNVVTLNVQKKDKKDLGFTEKENTASHLLKLTPSQEDEPNQEFISFTTSVPEVMPSTNIAEKLAVTEGTITKQYRTPSSTLESTDPLESSSSQSTTRTFTEGTHVSEIVADGSEASSAIDNEFSTQISSDLRTQQIKPKINEAPTSENLRDDNIGHDILDETNSNTASSVFVVNASYPINDPPENISIGVEDVIAVPSKRIARPSAISFTEVASGNPSESIITNIDNLTPEQIGSFINNQERIDKVAASSLNLKDIGNEEAMVDSGRSSSHQTSSPLGGISVHNTTPSQSDSTNISLDFEIEMPASILQPVEDTKTTELPSIDTPASKTIQIASDPVLSQTSRNLLEVKQDRPYAEASETAAETQKRIDSFTISPNWPNLKNMKTHPSNLETVFVGQITEVPLSESAASQVIVIGRSIDAVVFEATTNTSTLKLIPRGSNLTTSTDKNGPVSDVSGISEAIITKPVLLEKELLGRSYLPSESTILESDPLKSTILEPLLAVEGIPLSQSEVSVTNVEKETIGSIDPIPIETYSSVIPEISISGTLTSEKPIASVATLEDINIVHSEPQRTQPTTPFENVTPVVESTQNELITMGQTNTETSILQSIPLAEALTSATNSFQSSSAVSDVVQSTYEEGEESHSTKSGASSLEQFPSIPPVAFSSQSEFINTENTFIIPEDKISTSSSNSITTEAHGFGSSILEPVLLNNKPAETLSQPTATEVVKSTYMLPELKEPFISTPKASIMFEEETSVTSSGEIAETSSSIRNISLEANVTAETIENIREKGKEIIEISLDSIITPVYLKTGGTDTFHIQRGRIQEEVDPLQMQSSHIEDTTEGLNNKFMPTFAKETKPIQGVLREGKSFLFEFSNTPPYTATQKPSEIPLMKRNPFTQENDNTSTSEIKKLIETTTAPAIVKSSPESVFQEEIPSLALVTSTSQITTNASPATSSAVTNDPITEAPSTPGQIGVPMEHVSQGVSMTEVTLTSQITTTDSPPTTTSDAPSTTTFEPITVPAEQVALASTSTAIKEIFKCISHGVFPDKNDCRQYYLCVQQPPGYVKIKGLCPPRLAFDFHEQRCVPDVASCYESKCETEGYFPDPLDDSSYFWCNANSTTGIFHKYHLECGPSLKFIETLGACDDPMKPEVINLMDRTTHVEATTETIVSNTVDETPTTVLIELEYREMAVATNKYETAFIESFPIDSQQHVASTGLNSPRIQEQPTTANTENLIRTARQIVYPFWKLPFQCYSHGIFPHKDDCSKYHMCVRMNSSYIAQLDRSCQSRYAFNLETLSCTRDLAGCSELPCVEVGNFPHPYDDTSYYSCRANGKGGFHKYHIKCQHNMSYVPEMDICSDGEQYIVAGKFSPRQATDLLMDEIPIEPKVQKISKRSTVDPSDTETNLDVTAEEKHRRRAEKRLLKIVERMRNEAVERDAAEEQRRQHHEREMRKRRRHLRRHEDDSSEDSSDSEKSEDNSSEESDKKRFRCRHEGEFQDPENHRRYFICSAKKKGKLKKHHMWCDDSLRFDSRLKICVHQDETHD